MISCMVARKINKEKSKKFSAENNMNAGSIPSELNDLNQCAISKSIASYASICQKKIEYNLIPQKCHDITSINSVIVFAVKSRNI